MLPAAGVVAASGGNAGLAVAYAADRHGLPARVYVPGTAPAVKVARLRDYGA
jgi:threonine dehydratase